MATDRDDNGWSDTMQVSRRALFRFLPHSFREPPTFDEVEVEAAPVAVPAGELRAHESGEINRFLARLQRRNAAGEPDESLADDIRAEEK